MTLLVNASELNTFDKITLNKTIHGFHPKFIPYSLNFYTLEFVGSLYKLIVEKLKEQFPAIQITLKSKVANRTVYTEL